MSPEERIKNKFALEAYNAKWAGDNAPKTRSLFAAACKGKGLDWCCDLQDHVLALLGHTQARHLPSDSFSPATQEWVAWMIS